MCIIALVARVARGFISVRGCIYTCTTEPLTSHPFESSSHILRPHRSPYAGLGIPVKLLHEAEGHVVTCELNNGEMYRGKLMEAEDNMNSQFVDVQYTDRSGKTSHLESVYIRGSKIRFLVLPDMLKHAPMFKNMKKSGVQQARGKTAVLRAQALAQAKKR